MNFTKIFSILCLAAAALFSGTGSAVAQSETDTIAAIRAQIGANRQALVAGNLNLDESESADFWPLYREFHIERDALMDQRVKLLREFRDNFDGLTDDRSKQIVDDYFTMEEDVLKLRKKYRKKFAKILSDKKTLRYLQIESKLDTIIDYDLARVVPLAQ